MFSYFENQMLKLKVHSIKIVKYKTYITIQNIIIYQKLKADWSFQLNRYWMKKTERGNYVGQKITNGEMYYLGFDIHYCHKFLIRISRVNAYEFWSQAVQTLKNLHHIINPRCRISYFELNLPTPRISTLLFKLIVSPLQHLLISLQLFNSLRRHLHNWVLIILQSKIK